MYGPECWTTEMVGYIKKGARSLYKGDKVTGAYHYSEWRHACANANMYTSHHEPI